MVVLRMIWRFLGLRVIVRFLNSIASVVLAHFAVMFRSEPRWHMCCGTCTIDDMNPAVSATVPQASLIGMRDYWCIGPSDGEA